jgi:hypothetical protein
VLYKNATPVVPSTLQGLKSESDKYLHSENVFFVFIDILGFKDDYLNAKADKIKKKFSDFFEHYFEMLAHSKIIDDYTPFEGYAGQTSDSLFFYTYRIDYLIEYLKFYTYFSLYAMQNEIFLRGGVAKETLVTSQKYQFFGPSVINAYLLESEISKYPVVTIDKTTFDEIIKVISSDTSALLINSDKAKKRYYLQPFYYLAQQRCLSSTSFEESFAEEINKEKINRVLCKQLTTYEYNDKIYPKYVFLKNEFDKILDESK